MNKTILYGLICFLILPFYARAGSSPETTLVVVNADSPLSVRIANEYVHLRNIPQSHVVWLDGITSMATISIDNFRKKIWFPIRDYIRSHKLEEEIDLITYSGDFPYAVDFKSDIRFKKLQRSKYRGNIASLTALTYFARRVEVGDIGFLGKNHYFRDFAGPKITAKPSHPATFSLLEKREIRLLKNKAYNSLNKNPASSVKHYQKILDSYPAIPENWYNLSRSLAAAGERDKAIESLTSAVDHGWSNNQYTARDRFFKSFHSEPKFHKLLERMESSFGPFLLTQGFRNRYVWSNVDLAFEEPDDSLNQYYLSTMLAYTGGRGNSFAEIINYLKAAAFSDASQPDGTVYLLENTNVRSKTRQPLFSVTLAELARRKHKGEILYKGIDEQTGVLPIAKNDVIGVVAGFSKYQWEETNSRLLPGAIAETLTSYGGDFNKAKQTKLTEFLRHGAAGSSGAVVEPFAIQEKFPVPLIHAWYADGCSLAEAFYQSVEVPYQLIIVGDPLARPFAAFANIKLKSPQLIRPWSDVVTIEADIQPVPGKPISKVEFWVDGQYLFDVPAYDAFTWDTRTVEDGSHDVRLVAVEDSNIESRSSTEFMVRVSNHNRQVNVEYVSQGIGFGDTVEINGTAPDAEAVEILRGFSVLGTARVRGTRWRMVIPAKKFGIGPASFVVRASYQNGTAFRSNPVDLSIDPPESLIPVMDEKPSGDGLSAIVFDQEGKEHHFLISQLDGPLKELRKNKLKARQLQLDGYFYVTNPGFYQLVLAASGHLRISVNEQLLLDEHLSKNTGDAFLPISLKRGWYKLGIDLEFSGRQLLKVLLSGDQVPMILAGDRLGH